MADFSRLYNRMEFFSFAEKFFLESHLLHESKLLHIIEIVCTQNYHKALENWSKIGLFGALGGRILTKLIPKTMSCESNEYLLSLLRS